TTLMLEPIQRISASSQNSAAAPHNNSLNAGWVITRGKVETPWQGVLRYGSFSDISPPATLARRAF
ncbi:MAG: hypothetical protein WCH75_06395, partial [Candidatus Binatia bacterium]